MYTNCDVESTPIVWRTCIVIMLQQIIAPPLHPYRYKAEFKRLADKHWPDNLLLVTHEYGVMSAMGLAEHHEDVEATYCSSVELYRKEQAQQNWCVGRHHGVYKYDSLID